MKKLSTQVTQMELDLVKTKQELGDALNQIHELATEQDLDPTTMKPKKEKSKFFKMPTMFKGKGDKSNTDGSQSVNASQNEINL